ncbi:MAG: hypothetical protein ACRDQA_30685 [Nocardioidaceae bacterium]
MSDDERSFIWWTQAYFYAHGWCDCDGDVMDYNAFADAWRGHQQNGGGTAINDALQNWLLRGEVASWPASPPATS